MVWPFSSHICMGHLPEFVINEREKLLRRFISLAGGIE
jgi:hypothetical protein